MAYSWLGSYHTYQTIECHVVVVCLIIDIQAVESRNSLQCMRKFILTFSAVRGERGGMGEIWENRYPEQNNRLMQKLTPFNKVYMFYLE